MTSAYEQKPTETASPTNKRLCYICQDRDYTENLMPSPCGNCKMHVHQSCFDTHMVHQYKKHQCVVMKTGLHASSTDGEFVVYTSCSICKKRHEYSSKRLLNSIAQHLHISESEDDDIAERNMGHRYAVICTQFACSLIARVPEHIRDDTMTATHTIVRSLAIVSADDITHQIKNAFYALKASLYGAAFGIGLASLVCARKIVLSIMY